MVDNRPETFEDNSENIKYIYSAVTSVDPVAKSITLANGDPVTYVVRIEMG